MANINDSNEFENCDNNQLRASPTEIIYYSKYEALANEIVLKAVQDYRRTNRASEIRKLERFFKSQWFLELCNLDGRDILEKLQKEKKHESI